MFFGLCLFRTQGKISNICHYKFDVKFFTYNIVFYSFLSDGYAGLSSPHSTRLNSIKRPESDPEEGIALRRVESLRAS